jgi:hypothetical protein
MRPLHFHMGLNPHGILIWVFMRLAQTLRNCDPF